MFFIYFITNITPTKRTIYSLGLLSVVFITAISCHKDDDFTATMQNVAGMYGFTASTAQVGNGAVTDVFVTFPDCYSDNTLQINANGTYHFMDNSKVCDPTVEGTGVWSLPDPHTLVVDGFSYAITFDGKTMVERFSDTTNGVITKHTVTLVKQ